MRPDRAGEREQCQNLSTASAGTSDQPLLLVARRPTDVLTATNANLCVFAGNSGAALLRGEALSFELSEILVHRGDQVNPFDSADSRERGTANGEAFRSTLPISNGSFFHTVDYGIF